MSVVLWLSIMALIRFFPQCGLVLGVLVALLSVPTHAAALSTDPAACARYLRSTAAEFNRIRRQMRAELDQMPQFLASLALSPEAIEPVSYLGFGDSGAVFKVEYQGRLYALKVFKWLIDRETNESIVIQKALGELGVAPQVIGVLDYKSTKFWVKKHSVDSNHVGSAFALLMELTENRTLKNLRTTPEYRPRVHSPEQRQSLRDQMEGITRALYGLGVLPSDIDAVWTHDGRLLLIDLAQYSFFRDLSKYPEERARRSLERLVDRIDTSLVP